jgi:hypothetical protein
LNYALYYTISRITPSRESCHLANSAISQITPSCELPFCEFRLLVNSARELPSWDCAFLRIPPSRKFRHLANSAISRIPPYREFRLLANSTVSGIPPSPEYHSAILRNAISRIPPWHKFHCEFHHLAICLLTNSDIS